MITSMSACFYTGVDLLHEPYTTHKLVVVVKLTTHTRYNRSSIGNSEVVHCMYVEFG